jgi:hypothetical protein
MSTIVAYRYDNERYEVDGIITPRGDFFGSLTAVEKKVETALRDALADGHAIRGGSVFAWESETVAKRVWPLSGTLYLYELEILQADIRFRGDLNHYNNAADAAALDFPFDHHLEAYRTGAPSPNNGAPRIELLFSKAKALKRYE